MLLLCRDQEKGQRQESWTGHANINQALLDRPASPEGVSCLGSGTLVGTESSTLALTSDDSRRARGTHTVHQTRVPKTGKWLVTDLRAGGVHTAKSSHKNRCVSREREREGAREGGQSALPRATFAQSLCHHFSESEATVFLSPFSVSFPGYSVVLLFSISRRLISLSLHPNKP